MHSYLNISVAQLHDESGSGSMTQHFVATASPACEVAHYAQQQQCTRGCGSPRPGGGDTHRVRSYACPCDTRRGRRGSKTRAPPFLFCSQSLPRTGDAVAGLYTATQPLLKASGRKPARASKTFQDSCLLALGIRRPWSGLEHRDQGLTCEQQLY